MDQPINLTDVVTKLQQANQLLGQLVNVVTNWFPRVTGTFTMDAAASKAVTDSRVTSASVIVLVPTNAAAGTLQGSNESLYVTPANGSFTVATAAGTAASGTETFSYVAFTPL